MKNDSTIFIKYITSIGKNSVVYVIGDFVTKGIYFLLIPLYTRILSPSDYGITGVLNSVTSFLAILISFQLANAVTINYFKLFNEEQKKKLISSICSLSLILSFVLTLLILFGSKSIFSSLDLEIPFTPFIVLSILSASITGPIDILKAIYRIKEESYHFVGIVLLQFIINVSFTLFLIIQQNLGALGIILALLLSNMIVGWVSVFIIYKKYGFSISVNHCKDAIILSAPIVLHMLSHWGLNLMDRFLLQYYVSLEDIGIYQLGYQIGTIYQVLIIAVNNAWVPFFYKNIDQSSSHSMIRKLTNIITLFEFLFAFCVIIFSKDVILLFIDHKYAYAIKIVPWIVLGFICVTFYQLWVNILFSQKRTKLIPLATMFSAIINFIANIVLIPIFGILGSAVATAVSYFALAIFIYPLANHTLIFSYDMKQIFKILIAGGIITLLGVSVPISNIAIDIAYKLQLIIVFFVILYLLQFFTQEDLKKIKSIFMKFF